METKSKKDIDLGKIKRMAEILKLIGHPIRLKILRVLDENPSLTVAEVQEKVEIEQSLLSHHLIKMKDKGVLKSSRNGRNINYSLKDRQILKIFDCMERCDVIL